MKLSVVGSLNMDTIVHTDRIPLKGETISGRRLEHLPGGKGANQAAAMGRLGAEVEMFGCVGADDAGQALINNLRHMGVRTEQIRKVEGVPTGQAFITVGDHDNTIIVVAGANDCVDIDYITSVEASILNSSLVVLQNEIPQETIDYVIRICHAHGVRVIWNPAPARALSLELIELITYLTPNEHETLLIFGEDHSLEELMRQYPEKLIVTQGSQGVSACLRSGELLNVPAQKVEVVDTTGAGDTLNGAFAVKIAQGASLYDALTFANAAAGLSVQKTGAQSGMPCLEEVHAVLGRGKEGEITDGIIDTL